MMAAPDFETAWKWADWGNRVFSNYSDISRFTVALWPWDAKFHASDLPRSIEKWELPE